MADLGARLNIPASRQVVGPQRPVGLGVERVAPGDGMVERVPEVDDLAGVPALRRVADGGRGRLAVRAVARVPEQGDEALCSGDRLQDLPPRSKASVAPVAGSYDPSAATPCPRGCPTSSGSTPCPRFRSNQLLG